MVSASLRGRADLEVFLMISSLLLLGGGLACQEVADAAARSGTPLSGDTEGGSGRWGTAFDWCAPWASNGAVSPRPLS